jgi:hypothetical protein
VKKGESHFEECEKENEHKEKKLTNQPRSKVPPLQDTMWSVYLLGTLLFIKAKAAFVTSALLQDNNNYVHILFL